MITIYEAISMLFALIYIVFVIYLFLKMKQKWGWYASIGVLPATLLFNASSFMIIVFMARVDAFNNIDFYKLHFYSPDNIDFYKLHYYLFAIAVENIYTIVFSLFYIVSFFFKQLKYANIAITILIAFPLIASMFFVDILFFVSFLADLLGIQ